MKKFTSLALVCLLFYVSQVNAQKETSPKQLAILFGLNQPILFKGFNVEVNLYTNKMVFDYSHGISLEIDGSNVSDKMKNQGLVAHIPFTTGFGVGYRFSKIINLRIEPKLHQYELYYAGDSQTETNKIGSYNTFTLGMGLYFRLLPFEKKANALKGLIIAPSIRYWPNIATSLENDKLTYLNSITQKLETHEALSIGANNSPLVINVSIGYVFQFKKNK